ncbi:membrane hypothetical protein [uncultured delta proteobacterium]|uniref:Response regulatory domain-containing protein n=1 Tax=uncultured delta proteobacterium TaxID=34034 RepID=A0A212JEA1_9DELT|nr:membrane hypothetical protein [uncultured delta proteobacterium]
MLQTVTGASRVFRLLGIDRLHPASVKALRHMCGFLAVMAFLLAMPLQAAAQRGVAISYLADETASLGIEAVVAAEKAGAFRGYVPSFMAFSRLPDTFNGAVWLKITFDATFERPVTALHADFGTALPGVTRLFIPQPNGSFAVMECPPPHGQFTLPENTPFSNTLYARIDGTPGLWFRPFLSSAEDGPHALPLHFILGGLFGAAMLLLLIQYVRKAEEWRLWAAITAGCGIVAAILPPTPVAGAAYTPLMAAAMLMPGLILTFFAHTTRHLFDSPRTMPGYDKLLVFLYLAGAAIALLPLVPGFLWVSRYLPFANTALLPLLSVCMVAMARSLRGCSVYFCACLLPVLGVAASAWELTATDTPAIAGTGGLWGLALAMLAMAFIAPARKDEAKAEDDVFDSLNRSPRLSLREETLPEDLPPAAGPSMVEETAPAAWEPAAREEDAAAGPDRAETTPAASWADEAPAAPRPVLPEWEPVTEAAPEDQYPSLSLFGNPLESVEPPAPSPAAQTDAGLPIPDSALEPRSRAFAAEAPAAVEKAPAAPEKTPFPAPAIEPREPEAAAQPAVDIFPAATAVKEEAAIAETPAVEAPAVHVVTIAEEEPEDQVPLPSPAPLWDEREQAAEADDDTAAQQQSPAMERRRNRRMLFNLPLLIKNAYDAVTPLAESKNCSMTWFIAPQTGRLFEGEAELLESALQLILSDMAEAVEQGNVRLNVRRLPDSAEPGHLVFTIVGWDARQKTAHERNIAGHAEAWALAERTGGIFSMEHSPSGTTVIFSAVFTAMDEPAEDSAAPRAPAAPSVPETGADAPAHAEPQGVSVFTDHPDIAMPAEAVEKAAAMPHTPVSDVPPGVDADSLADNRETKRSPYRVIVADSAASSRARTAKVFTGTAYSVLECTSPQDACALYTRHPAAVVIMNADMPEVDITAAIKDIHADDADRGRTPAFTVALVGYSAQAARMMQAGCSRTVLKSLIDAELLRTVEELAPPPGAIPAPALPEQTAPARPEPATPEIRLDAALSDIPPVREPAGPSTVGTAPATAETPAAPERGIFASVLPPSPPAAAQPAAPAVTPRPTEKVAATPAAAKSEGPELALLDMIITDDDEEPAAAPQPAKPAKSVKVTVKAAAKPVVKQSTEETAAPAAPAPSPAPVAASTTAAIAAVTAAVAEQPRKAAAPEAVPAEPGVGTFSPAPAPISIPLPGEEDSVFKDMLPLVPGLVIELNDAMADAERGKAQKSPMLVQAAAARVAGEAESFGLTRLERMARCVERAAAADDIEPMECVLADLEAWIERYTEALRKLHREAQW